MISYHDYANSGNDYVNAIQECSKNIDIAYIKRGCEPKGVSDIVGNAEVLWFKGDNLPVKKNGRIYLLDFNGKPIKNFAGWSIKENSKILITAGGSAFRRPIAGYKHAIGKIPLSRYKEVADKITSISPDLNYPEIKGEWLPHAYDVKNCGNNWRVSDNMTISYYKGKGKKGVEKYLIPTIEELKSNGYKINALQIHGVTHKESVDIKRSSTLYFESIKPHGCYGKSGVESMSNGIPTICHISDTSIKQATPYNDYGDPCLSVKTLGELYRLLEHVILGKIDLNEISKASVSYAINHHSYKNVSLQIERIISEMI